jgi:hypothetical protein
MEQEEILKDLVGQCDVVHQNHHVKENDIEYSKKGLDDIIKRVVQGKELCQVEHQNLDHVLGDIKKQKSLLGREIKVVQVQLG